MAPPPGKLGRYDLLRELGRGGMGVVYEARDPAMPEKPLALKLILAQGAGPEELARFRREAEALARFRHPHVVPVHELLVTPQGPCLVTDLIPGQELAALRKRQLLDPRECARIVRDLADAVQGLHAKGILHRDLKPQNVILTPDGRPILLDFGLVRVGGAQSLTQTGALLGTPAYMSPEQAGGEKRVDARSDVYALGAVLYFLLTGETPFTGTTIQILHQVLRGAPPPRPSSRTADLEIDRELDTICLRALAGAVEARYPTAAALRDALSAYLDPPAKPRSAARAVALTGLAGLLIAATALALLGPPTATPLTAEELASSLSETSWDTAQDQLQAWLTAHAGHPEAGRVTAWRDGYAELDALASRSARLRRLPTEATERWLARFHDHPALADAERIAVGSRALDDLLAGLAEVAPSEARARLTAWRAAHPQHPDGIDQDGAGSWLSAQLAACDSVADYRRQRDAATLRAWASRHPELPSLAWLGRAYTRVGLERDTWISPASRTTRPRAAFLPGERLRFLTWGFASWAESDPLTLWELTPERDDPVREVSSLRLKDGAVVLQASASADGSQLSLLLGLPPSEVPEDVGALKIPHAKGLFATALVPAFPLDQLGVSELSSAELLAGEGAIRFPDWRCWLARVEVDGELWLACAGERAPRDERGRELTGELAEGVCWVRRGAQEQTLSTPLPVHHVAFSDDGRLLALATGRYAEGQRTQNLEPQEVLVLDARSLERLASYPNLAALPSRLGFIPGTHRLIVCAHDQSVIVFDLEPEPAWRRLVGSGAAAKWSDDDPAAHNGIVRDFVVEPEGRYVLTVSGESGEDLLKNPDANELRVFDLNALDDTQREPSQAMDDDDSRQTDLPLGLWGVSLAPTGHWLLLSTNHRICLRQWLLPGD